MTVAAHASPPPSGGEPQLARDSSAPPGPRLAAVRFVEDYTGWASGRLATIPAPDATARVIRLLERAGSHAIQARSGVEASVRIAPVGVHRYVVTSTVGNFLIDQRGSRWLVVSLPGD